MTITAMQARRRPLLLVHEPSFGGMGAGSAFLLDACARTGISTYTLELTTPGRDEATQGRLTAESLRHVLSLYRRYIRLLVRQRASLVYIPIAQWGLPLVRDLVLVSTASMFGARVVVHVHGSQLIERVGKPRRARDRVIRALLRSKTWAVLSPALRDVLVSTGAAHSVSVLRNPAYPAARHISPTSDVVRVGFLGWCSTEKGLDILVSACGRLERERPAGVHLTVAGPIGNYGPPALPWLTYLGKVDREKLEQSFWPSVDILVLPARWQEGLPFVVLEALQRGKLVLASDSLGMRELVEGRAVLVVRPDVDACTAALSAATADLLGQAEDAQTRWAEIRPRFEPERVRQEWLAGIGLHA